MSPSRTDLIAAVLVILGTLALVLLVRKPEPPPKGAVLLDPPPAPRSLFAPQSEAPAELELALRQIGERHVEVLLGKVLAPDGTPVRGAAVSLGKYRQVTDEGGAFVVPRGWGRVKISHPDFFPRELSADAFSVATIGAAELALDDSARGSVQTIVLRPGSRVDGRVRGPQGEPVAKARIRFGESESLLESVTREDGSYESPLLPHGLVPVFATHPDYQPEGSTLSIPVPGARVGWSPRLQLGEKLKVRVTDTGGKPLPDAEVWIRLGEKLAPGAPRLGPSRLEPLFGPSGEAGATPADLHPEAPPLGPVEWKFLGRSDDLGLVETCREAGRRASVRVTLAGFRDEVRDVEGSEVRVPLKPGPAFKGHVVDARSGLPLHIERVRLEVLVGTEFQPSVDRGRLFRCLAAGRFVVGLPPQSGTYRVAVVAEGDRGGHSEPVTLDGKTSPPDVIIKVERQINLKGFVRGPAGPIAGARVELLEADVRDRPRERIFSVMVPAAFGVLRESQSNADGDFSFEGLRPGLHRLRVRVPGWAEHLSPPFDVPWEEEYPVILKRGSRLSGTVLGGDGLPEPDVPVILVRRNEAAQVAWTDGEGRYSFADLAPHEEYAIHIGDPRGAQGEAGREDEGEVERHSVTLEEGRDCIFDIRAKRSEMGSVQGRLIVDGRPAAGIPLALASAAPPSRREAASDAGGEFLWRALPPGTYWIEGAALPSSRKVEVVAGQRTRVDIETRSLSLALELVKEGTREPFPLDAEVVVRRSGAGGDGTRGSVAAEGEVPAAAGGIELKGLCPGDYRVSVAARGAVLVEVPLSLQDHARRVLALQVPVDVSVRLLSAEGSPFQGEARVHLYHEGREIYRSARRIEGKVTVPVPAPGIYELCIEAGDQSTRERFELSERAFKD